MSSVYATDKSSLSSLDCLSSIVDRITNTEQPGLPLQDLASLSPAASTDSQPATPGASSSRLIYHVLWTRSLVSTSCARGAHDTRGRRPQSPKARQPVYRFPFNCKFVYIVLSLYKKVYLTKNSPLQLILHFSSLPLLPPPPSFFSFFALDT